ncbi:MAG: glycerophosphodiester phosphodiesterase, partial [Polyangiales bacterium]
ALEQGADGIELDVRLCKSGEVLVLHDADLLRVAGKKLVAAESTFDELQSCDLGASERVPTLEQAMSLVLDGGKLLNVELKSDVPDPEALVRSVAACIAARPREQHERIVLSSFGRELCRAACEALPEITVALLFERVAREPPPGTRAVHPHHSLAHADAVAHWQAHALLVNVWTVNDVEQARALAAAGVDGIITDDVPLVRAALAGVAE